METPIFYLTHPTNHSGHNWSTLADPSWRNSGPKLPAKAMALSWASIMRRSIAVSIWDSAPHNVTWPWKIVI